MNLRDFQRTGRDSNPRYAFDVHTISNRALSTTQTPAQSNLSSYIHLNERKQSIADFPRDCKLYF